jgi:CheY-like chemotaxis protein
MRVQASRFAFIRHQTPEVGAATLPRLLVVEDDPDQSRMLCDRLKLYGYAVACANDGPAALEMLTLSPITVSCSI